MEIKCLQCGHEFEFNGASKDDLGWCVVCPDCNGSFDLDIEIVVDDVLNQMEKYENGYGEPQAFIDAAKDRSVEIVHEMEGLSEDQQFYSCIVNGTEEDIDKGIASDYGVIDRVVSAGLTREDLRKLVEYGLYCAERV